MKKLSVVLLFCISALNACGASDGEQIKKLCSFEPDEMIRMNAKGGTQTPSESLSKQFKQPVPGIVVSLTGFNSCRLAKSHCTDGEHAIVNIPVYFKRGARMERFGVLNQYSRLFGMNWVRDFLKQPDWSA